MFSKIVFRKYWHQGENISLRALDLFNIQAKLILSISLLILTTNLSAFSQSIPLTLVAKDSRTGMQINPNFEAKSMKVDLDLKVSKVQNYMIVKVQSGDKVIIKAQLDGYYPDEKIYEIDDEFDSEGRNVVFELDPQPAANLSFTVVDKINGKQLNAEIYLSSNGELIKKISSSDASGLSNILLTLPGKYSIKTSSEGYETNIIEQEVTVNDPPVKIQKNIELERKKNTLTLLIADGTTKAMLQDVKLRVTNSAGDVLKNSRTTENSTDINLKDANEITIEAEAKGYQVYKKTFDVKENKLTIELQKEANIKIEVLDGFNKDRISATVVITSPTGKNTTIKTSESEVYIFVPSEKGDYKYTTTKEGFQPQTGSLNISQLKNYENELSIKLNSIYEDFIILVFDEEKLVVPAVDVRVFDRNEKELPIEFEKSTGEWIVKLVRTERYTFSAAVKGYQVSKGDLDLSKGKLIPVVLSKDLLKIKILTLDKFSQKPVLSSISYKDKGSDKSEAPKSEHQLSISPGEILKPIFAAKGYKQYEADEISSETNATILMIAEKYPIKLNFTDVKGVELVPDYISIINKETSSPETIQKDNIVFLDAEANYYIDVKKAGYANHSSPFLPAIAILENNSLKTVKLSPKEFVTQKIKVVNSESNELVPALVVKATSTSGTALVVTNEENNWVIQVKNGESFSLSLDSKGYESKTQEFENVTEEVEVIKLSKLQANEQIFEAYDEILQRFVPAKFTLIDSEKTKDLQTFDLGARAKSEILKNTSYTIRISATDYQDKEETFFSNETPAAPIRLIFKRRTYPVKFVLKTNESKPLKSPSLTVSADQSSVTTSYLFDSKTFTADLKTGEVYDLVLNVDGFKPISEKVSISDLAETNLTREYNLEEIITEKPIEEKKEVVKVAAPVAPKVVEVKPIVVEKPTPKPTAKVANPYTKNSDNLTNMPDSKETVLAELSSKEAIGKRYILTKVYFEQGSPKIQAQSEEQLNSILHVLKSNPNLKIELVGHTDNIGDSRQNQYLSKFRAKVVGNYLYNNGINDSRIITKGMGGEYPVAENNTEENKAKNRRVELIVIEN